MIRVQLLGPVAVRRGGEDVVVKGPQQALLLALLALEPGRIIPADELVERAWAGRPPTTAAAALRVHLARLRQLLEEGPGSALPRGRQGYVLDAGLVTTDLQELAALRGRVAAEPDPAAGLALVERALSLWRGEPFGGAVQDPELRVAAEQAAEARLDLEETRAECLLRLGRHPEAATLLAGLVAAHPLRERRSRLLMLAQYRAGRQADALATFRNLRDRLIEEFGVEPGEETRRLEAQILRQDSRLREGETAGEPAAVPDEPMPDAARPVGPSSAALLTLVTERLAGIGEPAARVVGLAAVLADRSADALVRAAWHALNAAALDPEGARAATLRAVDACLREGHAGAAEGLCVAALDITDAAATVGVDLRTRRVRALAALARADEAERGLLVAAAQRTGDPWWRGIALLGLLRDAFVAGDLREVPGLLAGLGEAAELSRSDRLAWYHALNRATLHRDLGDGAAADHWAEEAVRRGAAVGLPDALVAAQLQRVLSVFLRSSTARLADADGAFEGLQNTLGHAVRALAQAEAGRADRAGVEIERGLAWLVREWPELIPVGAGLLTQAAHAARAREFAEPLRALLAPYGGQFAVLGQVAATLGPVDRCLGLLADLSGDPAGAETLLAGAEDQCAGGGNPVWRVVTAADRVGVQLAAGSPAVAASLARLHLDAAAQLGLGPSVAVFRAALGLPG